MYAMATRYLCNDTEIARTLVEHYMIRSFVQDGVFLFSSGDVYLQNLLGSLFSIDVVHVLGVLTYEPW